MKTKLPRSARAEETALAAKPRFATSGLDLFGIRPVGAAKIVVRGCDGADLIDTCNATEANGTFFGRIPMDSPSGITRTFTIYNEGTAPLELGEPWLEGTGASEFEILEAAGQIVEPGQHTELRVRYIGAFAGPSVALVNLPSNDPGEQPYLFLVEGEAIPA